MPVIPPKPKQVVNSKAVLDSVAGRPRYHLGDVLYDPSFQPARLAPSVPSRRGYSTTPNPLPLEKISGKENCTLTVKVAKIHLTPSAREEITSRRALWGTEVYTDDSDVVAACIHGGWIRGEWPDDVDVSLLDLDHGIQNDGVVEKESRRKKDREAEAKARLEANAANFLSAPPRTGPVHVPADRDLHVTLVVLPKLQKYTSTTRFGIQSREFGGYGRRQPSHDGLSFMITGVRWVENGARPQSQLRGKARRERMRRAMREVGVSFKGVNGVEGEAEKDSVGRLRGELERTAIVDGEKNGGGARGEAGGNGEFDKENRPAEGDAGDVREEDVAEKGDKGTEVKA
ncbi:uncharacterized protein DNG_08294 [Cephalotrichum gorgonifer]|uniref:Histone deacetylation protein Rxt3 n=1 Tax=Cephalotrichum gorgonifer TaxID=2041049 RepID=A0AAE8N666_9PEZI|nr:uncharacterized protein DNG_08294 [Cephalotrichum gorgonifer]